MTRPKTPWRPNFEATAERLLDCRCSTASWHNAVWQRGGFSNVRWKAPPCCSNLSAFAATHKQIRTLNPGPLVGVAFSLLNSCLSFRVRQT